MTQRTNPLFAVAVVCIFFLSGCGATLPMIFTGTGLIMGGAFVVQQGANNSSAAAPHPSESATPTPTATPEATATPTPTPSPTPTPTPASNGDSTPPQISTTSPVNGANGVGVSSPITITFSEEMNGGSVSAQTVTISTGGSNLTGTSVDFSNSTKTATLSLASNMEYGTTYSVAVSTGAKDHVGNPLSEIYTFSFTTVPAAPSNVTATASTNVSRRNDITWTTASSTAYRIYRSTISDFTPAASNLLSSSAQSPYADTGLFGGVTYYYKAIAVDSFGAASSSSSQASATAPFLWTTSTVAALSGVGGSDPELLIDSSGTIHMIYFVGGNENVPKYVSMSPGGNWSPPVTLDTRGRYLSMAIDSAGKLHISCYHDDSATKDLKYITNKSGSWVATTVDSSGDTGQFTSIALDSNDNIHISYYNADSGDLKYATKSNAGSTWATETVDSTGDVGRTTSIGVDGVGSVHIAYQDFTNKDLKYAAKTVGGNWSTTLVDAGESAIGNDGVAIAVSNSGNVYIAYADSDGITFAYLKVATKLASGGSFTTEIADGAGAGQRPDLLLDASGKLHVSYRTQLGATDTRMQYATNASGSWKSSLIELATDTGRDTTIAMDSSGKIHTGYYDQATPAIRYAVEK